jgi:hypothetical protein
MSGNQLGVIEGREVNSKMNDYVVSFKRSRMLTLALLSFIFTVIGVVFIIAFATQGIGSEKIWLTAIGVVIAIFFGLCLLYYIIVLIKGKPALKITKEGIIDNSSFIGAGLVRWEDIADIDFINFSNQVFLGIFTFDPDLITDRTTGFKRLLNNLNKGLLETQVNIPIKILDGSLDELVDEINSRWSVVREANTEKRERMTGPTKTLEDLK